MCHKTYVTEMDIQAAELLITNTMSKELDMNAVDLLYRFLVEERTRMNERQ